MSMLNVLKSFTKNLITAKSIDLTSDCLWCFRFTGHLQRWRRLFARDSQPVSQRLDNVPSYLFQRSRGQPMSGNIDDVIGTCHHRYVPVLHQDTCVHRVVVILSTHARPQSMLLLISQGIRWWKWAPYLRRPGRGLRVVDTRYGGKWAWLARRGRCTGSRQAEWQAGRNGLVRLDWGRSSSHYDNNELHIGFSIQYRHTSS